MSAYALRELQKERCSIKTIYSALGKREKCTVKWPSARMQLIFTQCRSGVHVQRTLTAYLCNPLILMQIVQGYSPCSEMQLRVKGMAEASQICPIPAISCFFLLCQYQGGGVASELLHWLCTTRRPSLLGSNIVQVSYTGFRDRFCWWCSAKWPERTGESGLLRWYIGKNSHSLDLWD